MLLTNELMPHASMPEAVFLVMLGTLQTCS